jgi:hypothetical protein
MWYAWYTKQPQWCMGHFPLTSHGKDPKPRSQRSRAANPAGIADLSATTFLMAWMSKRWPFRKAEKCWDHLPEGRLLTLTKLCTHHRDIRTQYWSILEAVRNGYSQIRWITKHEKWGLIKEMWTGRDLHGSSSLTNRSFWLCRFRFSARAPCCCHMQHSEHSRKISPN